MAKHNKYAYSKSKTKKINGRTLKFPAGTPQLEIDGVEFVASIIAQAHAENPEENWLSRCQPWVKEAVEMMRG